MRKEIYNLSKPTRMARKTREQCARDVERYLAAGGEIEVLPPFVHNVRPMARVHGVQGALSG